MLRERFTADMKEAMKAGDKSRLGAVRLIQAALKDKDIEARGACKEPLSDEEILALLQKMVKQREESFAIYAQAGRNDLATVEKEEIDILNEFLPKSLSESEVDDAIKAAIATVHRQPARPTSICPVWRMSLSANRRPHRRDMRYLNSAPMDLTDQCTAKLPLQQVSTCDPRSSRTSWNGAAPRTVGPPTTSR